MRERIFYNMETGDFVKSIKAKEEYLQEHGIPFDSNVFVNASREVIPISNVYNIGGYRNFMQKKFGDRLKYFEIEGDAIVFLYTETEADTIEWDLKKHATHVDDAWWDYIMQNLPEVEDEDEGWF